MLANIKAYQSETTSQHCPFQNSTLCLQQVVCLAAMLVHIHKKCSSFTD